ncbi:MAG: TCP-1/cpn60 chaperonin family protein [Caldilineaceae bacterium]
MNRPLVVSQPTTSKHFKHGIDRIGDLLAPTLGPTGGHIASQRDSGMKVELLDDAATIVRRILSIGSAQHDIGAMVMRNLIWRVAQRAGDGGATAAVLARAFFNEGLRLVTAGVNPVRLERGVNRAIKQTLELLKQQARPAVDEDMLASVARTITKENEMSAMLGEMSYLLGPDAFVMVEKYVAPYLEREYINGAHYKAKISSMYFYSDPQRKRAVVTAPAVAIVDGKVTEADQALALMEGALNQGAKSLVIVAQDVSGAALGLLLMNHQAPKEKKKLDVLTVKLNTIGDERRWAWDDLCTMTGARLLGPNTDRDAASARPQDLGRAQRAEYANEGIVIVANREARDAIQAEVSQVRAYIQETPLDDEDRSKHVKRLGTLTGGIGRLKIGTSSKLEREMMFQQAQRSFNVLSAAQRGGVAPGGGAGLLHCVPALEATAAANGASEEEIMGIQLVARVLPTPFFQIVKNAGMDHPPVIIDRVYTAGADYTYDALNGCIVNAYESGILDVVDVLSTALATAASGAMMALTTDAIVYHKDPKQSMQP